MILVMSHISGIHTKFVIYGPLFGYAVLYEKKLPFTVKFYCLACRKVMSYFFEYFVDLILDFILTFLIFRSIMFLLMFVCEYLQSINIYDYKA